MRKAHRLFRDDVHSLCQRREDRLRMKMIRRGDREHIEIREVPQNRLPRFIAMIGARLVAGEFLEIRRSLLRGRLRARGDGDQ